MKKSFLRFVLLFGFVCCLGLALKGQAPRFSWYQLPASSTQGYLPVATTSVGGVYQGVWSDSLRWYQEELILKGDKIEFDKYTNEYSIFLQGGDPGDMRFMANNNTALVIDDAGQVAINTTSPTTDFHVFGDMRLTGDWYDSNNSTGSNNWLLSQDAGGTLWKDPATISLSSFNDDINAANLWLENGSDIYYSAGSVGVGTSTPARELHVYDTDLGAYLEIGHSGTGATNMDGLVIGVDNANWANIIQYENAPIRWYTNGTQYMLLDATGQLGINETSPSQPLHVSGNVRFTADLYDSNNSSGLDDYLLSQDAGGTIWKDPSTIALSEFNNDIDAGGYWTESAGEIYRLSNVGIGNSNPGYLLEVDGGDIMVDSIRLEAGGQLRNYNTETDINSVTGGSTQGFIIEGKEGFHNVFGIRENDAGDGFFIISGGGNYTTDDTYDTVVFAAMSDGNVGINTNNPLAGIHVIGDGRFVKQGAAFRLQGTGSGTANQTYIDLYDASTRQAFFGMANASTNDFSFVNETSNGSMTFLTNGTTRLTIDENGLTGIGNTTPGYILEVDGGDIMVDSIQIEGAGKIRSYTLQGDINNMTGGSTSGFLIEGRLNHHNVFGIRENDAGDGFFILSGGGNYTTDNLYDLTVFSAMSDGTVGIQTNNPTQEFDVNGDTRLRGDLYDSNNSSGSNDWVLSQDAGGILWADPSTIFTGLWSENGTEIYYDVNHVGIGTNNPAFGLDVVEDVRFKKAGQVLRLDGTGTGSLNQVYLSYYDGAGSRQGYFGFAATSNDAFYLVNERNGDMYFRTNASTRMTIQADGDIGIGTTGPSYKLDVFGDMRLYDTGTSTAQLISEVNTTSGYIVYQDVDDTGYVLNSNSTARDYIWQSNGAEVMKVDNGTNYRRLQVDGSGRFERAGVSLELVGGATGVTNVNYLSFHESDETREGYFGFVSSGNNDLFINNDNSDGRILLYNAGTGKYALYADETGAVGIFGDPGASNRLIVAGGVGDDAKLYSLNVTTGVPTVTGTETNYIKTQLVNNQQTNIDLGVTDNGYRIGTHSSNHQTTTYPLHGYLATKIGFWIQVGDYLSTSTGTLNRAVGLQIDGYSTGTLTINDKYAIYQTGSDYKNYFAGKIAYNTTSPTQGLDINGNARFRSHIYDSNNSAGSTGQVLGQDAGGIIWEDRIWQYNGTEIYYDANFVGINTTNPSEWLHVDGDSYFSGEIGIGTSAPSDDVSLYMTTGFATTNYIRGVYANVSNTSSGGGAAGDFVITTLHSTGTASNVLGGQFKTGGSGTITNAYVINVDAGSYSGSVTNHYGIHIEDQANTNVTNTYGIYQVGSDDENYFAGSTQLATQIRKSGDVSATLTGNVDDWNPGGLSSASILYVNGTGAYNISGITAQPDGTELCVCNIEASGGDNITMENEEGTSSAANRMVQPGYTDFTLNPGHCIWYRYRSTESRWRATNTTN